MVAGCEPRATATGSFEITADLVFADGRRAGTANLGASRQRQRFRTALIYFAFS